jgi:hypothetical protein
VTLKNPVLWSETGQLSGHHPELNARRELAQMEWRRRFYANLALLEERLRTALPEPEEVTVEDISAVGTAAEVLRTGEGSYIFHQAEFVVQDASSIRELLERRDKPAVMRQMVTYTVFGKKLELGMAEYELPILKVIEVVPQGQAPDSPAKVVVEAAGNAKMRFRMVD